MTPDCIYDDDDVPQQSSKGAPCHCDPRTLSRGPSAKFFGYIAFVSSVGAVRPPPVVCGRKTNVFLFAGNKRKCRVSEVADRVVGVHSVQNVLEQLPYFLVNCHNVCFMYFNHVFLHCI